MAKLFGSQRMVLQAINDLPKDPFGFVTDAQVAQGTNIAPSDVRDWIETLEGEGNVEVARTTAGLSTSITAKGRLQLGLYEPFPAPQAESPGPASHGPVLTPATDSSPVTTTGEPSLTIPSSPPLTPTIGPTTAAPPTETVDGYQVVLLIHGIRTQADWGPMVKSKLEVPGQIEVIPIKYGYFDAFRFWFPFWTRSRPVEKVYVQIRVALQKYKRSHPDAKLSIVAHSFGTYVVGQILKRGFDLQIHRLILCGSVLPQDFPWEQYQGRFDDDKVVNECGKADIWPVLAQSASWGYGASGTHGFGAVLVKDRFHAGGHGQYFEPEFVEKYWEPFILRGEYQGTDFEVKMPPTPLWISMLGILPALLKWAIVTAIPVFLWILFLAHSPLAQENHLPDGLHPKQQNLLGAKPSSDLRFELTKQPQQPSPLSDTSGQKEATRVGENQKGKVTSSSDTTSRDDDTALNIGINRDGTLIIQFRQDATEDQIKEVITKYSLIVRGSIPQLGYYFVALADTADRKLSRISPILHASLIIGHIRSEHAVKAVAKDVLVNPSFLPSPTNLAAKNQEGIVYFWDWRRGPDTPEALARDGNYGLKLARFPAAWNFNDAIKLRGITKVKVGILDEGFSDHEDLEFNVSQTSPSAKHYDHGNLIAGIIAAKFNNGIGIDGGSPFASLVVYSFGTNGNEIKGQFLSISDIIANLVEFIRKNNNIKVIIMSFSYNWNKNGNINIQTYNSVHDLVRAHGVIFRSVADLAADRGIIIVSPAGNNTSEGHPAIEAQWSSPLNWAALNAGISAAPAANIVVVESVGRDGRISAFSNVKGCISAPGESILSTAGKNSYAVRDGTSMAAAYAAALISLMYAYNPELSIDNIINILNIGIKNRPSRSTPAPIIDAFDAMVACRDDSLRDLADLNNDGRVDMGDFQIFRNALSAVEKTPGSNVWPRADLNGSGKLSIDPSDRRKVRGRMLSDLEVMMSVWGDPNVRADLLPSQL